MSEIKPALTPEEWAVGGITDEDGSVSREVRIHPVRDVLDFGPAHDPQEGFATARLHAVAALALHGQPFGFTWEDVDALRFLADGIDRQHPGGINAYQRVRALADRIAALLAPRP